MNCTARMRRAYGLRSTSPIGTERAGGRALRNSSRSRTRSGASSSTAITRLPAPREQRGRSAGIGCVVHELGGREGRQQAEHEGGAARAVDPAAVVVVVDQLGPECEVRNRVDGEAGKEA